MTERERLLAILYDMPEAQTLEQTADYLLKHGVVIPIVNTGGTKTTEKAYIERNAVVNGLRAAIKKYSDDKSEANKITALIFQRFAKEIEAVPAADVIEVVRCKDCKHYVYSDDLFCYCRNKNDGIANYIKPNDFCSYGERVVFDNGKT